MYCFAAASAAAFLEANLARGLDHPNVAGMFAPDATIEGPICRNALDSTRCTHSTLVMSLLVSCCRGVLVGLPGSPSQSWPLTAAHLRRLLATR